jgi:hypothetical protein
MQNNHHFTFKVANKKTCSQLQKLLSVPSSLVMTSEDGTHSGFQNVISKFTLHTTQSRQNQKNNIHIMVKV